MTVKAAKIYVVSFFAVAGLAILAAVGLAITGIYTIKDKNKSIAFQQTIIREMNAENQSLKSRISDLQSWPVVEYWVTVDAKEDGDGTKENPLQLERAMRFARAVDFSTRINIGFGTYRLPQDDERVVGSMIASEGANYTIIP